MTTATYPNVGVRTDRAQALNEIRHLSYLLDEVFRIPVINYRVGLDAALGLVPVIGDFCGMGISGYIIFKAVQLGVPRHIIGRMITNVLLDAVVGSIPLIGTLFDAVWKANKRNVRLIEQYLLS
jgi:hypothetical protein